MKIERKHGILAELFRRGVTQLPGGELGVGIEFRQGDFAGEGTNLPVVGGIFQAG